MQASCADRQRTGRQSDKDTSGLLQHTGFCELVGFQGKLATVDIHLELVGLRGAVGNRPGIARSRLFCLMVGDDADAVEHERLDSLQLIQKRTPF